MRDWLKDVYLSFKEQIRNVLIWLSALIILIILFGLFYTLLTPCGHGIKTSPDSPEFSSSSLSCKDFLTGIYFSAVTVSSLGYGDFSPIGFSRLLVGIEVLLGLVLISLMISRITSWPLSYHVQRLFSSDAQKRLEDYSKIFEENKSHLLNILSKYDVPHEESLQSDSPPKEDLILNFGKEIEKFKSNCIDLRDHFLYEVDKQKNFFEVVPKSGLVKIGTSIKDLFLEFHDSMNSLEDNSKKEILKGNRNQIIDAIKAQKETCSIVKNCLEENDVTDIFREIKNSFSKMEESYLATPDEGKKPDTESPDRVEEDSEGLE